MKIAICIPDNYPYLQKQFAFSFLSAVIAFINWSNKGTKQYELEIFTSKYGRVDDMRNALVNDALRSKADLIFWMDSDMTFPVDVIPRLLVHLDSDPKLEAVSGLYTYKTPPFLPHVYPKLEDGRFRVAATIYVDRPMIVQGAGFGCLLMRTSVFKRMKRPYFKMVIDDEGKITEGEDLGFCKRAKMKMVLDPKISCGHLAYAAKGIEDYKRWNGLDVVNGQIPLTKEKLSGIMKEMPHLQKVQGASSPSRLGKKRLGRSAVQSDSTS